MSVVVQNISQKSGAAVDVLNRMLELDRPSYVRIV